MCGIVGYIGKNEIKKVLLTGLKELEYRGYDSAGMAILEQGTNDFAIFKAVGKLINLEEKAKSYTTSSFGVGIGHTRWATHGKPNELNAHPHAGKQTIVVHNGIIENYNTIKKDLELKGYKFNSQTDTEIIAHLFEENLKNNDAKTAFKNTISALKGAYAILLITKAKPNEIFYAKNSAPLIIGKGKDGIYLASSNAPLIGVANEVVYLNDGDFGSVDCNSFDALENILPLNISKDLAQKDGFEFFMEKEIYEQHKILLDTILGRVDSSDSSVHLELDPIFFEGITSITICACGTSYHAGLVGKYILERIAKIKTEVVIASEYRYADFVLQKDELFLCISQSGETADTLEALKMVKKIGVKSLAICNVDNSSITRESSSYILTRAGIEKGVASTKAFASQVLVLWLLSIFIADTRGLISNEEKLDQIHEILESINATKIDSTLHERIRRLSKRYLHGHGFFFIGRDIFYPLALEGALKLKELSYLHAEGYASGEMKHGPIALVDSNLFTIALLSRHKLFDKMLNNIEELSARDATICAITSEECEVADDIIKLPKSQSYMGEFFSMMVALQLLSLEIAIKLGNDVDMPRNLAKSVTVE